MSGKSNKTKMDPKESLTMKPSLWQMVQGEVSATMRTEGKDEEEVLDIITRYLKQRRVQRVNRKVLQMHHVSLISAPDLCDGMTNAQREEWRTKNFAAKTIVSGQFDKTCLIPSQKDITEITHLVNLGIINVDTDEIDGKAMSAQFCEEALRIINDFNP